MAKTKIKIKNGDLIRNKTTFRSTDCRKIKGKVEYEVIDITTYNNVVYYIIIVSGTYNTREYYITQGEIDFYFETKIRRVKRIINEYLRSR